MATGRRGIARAVLIVAAALFIALQFVRPAISHPPVTADLSAPPEIKSILRTACYDCHSNDTHLAWFDEIVPAYWLAASDVKAARQHLNFSEIGMLPAAQQKGLLYEAVNQIRFHAMPLPAYARLHPSAALAPAQVKAIEDYLRAAPESDAASAKLPPPSETRTVLAAGAHSAAAAPNGIPFPEGYQHWKWISTTDRFDNQSIRAALGNPIAVQAARNHRGWPDGAMLAKVAWVAQPRADGRIEAGSFWQVQNSGSGLSFAA